MIKFLFDILKTLGFAFVYFTGDRIVRWLTGKDEFPTYYWIGVGLVLVYQIIRDLEEIKKIK